MHYKKEICVPYSHRLLLLYCELRLTKQTLATAFLLVHIMCMKLSLSPMNVAFC